MRSGPYAESESPRIRPFSPAAMIIKGPGGTKTGPVGAKLTLTAKGIYHLTMVRQAADDNHLTLKIT
jgi:hypothetical protein